MNDAPPRPLLLYDGECGFCAYWARYWQRLTGEAVRFEPFQAVLDERPELDPAECRRAVQLIEPDGRRLAGAVASFRVLELGGHPLGARVLRSSRLATRFAERAYTVVSRRRGAAFAAARALWGAERHPARYDRASALFVRLVALTYLAAFVSLATQVRGLVGERGILPAGRFLEAVAAALPVRPWLQVPTVFWFDARDAVLVGACVAGALAAGVAAAGRVRMAALALCYVLYLSLFYAGQDFMSFQWDLLLLEAGFLAIFLPLGTRAVPWLFRLLLFRFMFLSGCVKLLSGDPSWATLAALDFHYETQPLPTPLAWYAHQLPAWFDRACVLATFVVELALPFLVFAPRRPRMIALVGFVALETVIFVTGNYNFFNLLTIALCVFLVDDAQFARHRAGATHAAARRAPRLAPRLATALLAGLVAALNVYYLARPFLEAPERFALAHIAAPLAPLRIVNGYGLFAVMTRSRPEIVVQGSANGSDWTDYSFEYKPDDPARAPRWNVPHQPRLDWQMWFAALSGAQRASWFGNFLTRLLQDAPEVTGLLRENPFEEHPPRYVRALLYDYRFTTPAERAATGHVWRRSLKGLYFPAVGLR